MRLPVAILACLPLYLAAPATTQAEPAVSTAKTPNPRAVAGQGFVLEPGDINAGDLIDAAAKFLNRNILYSPAELQQACAGRPIHLQRRLELDARGCEEVLSSLLYIQGLALVPLDPERGFHEVIAMNGPRGRELGSRAVPLTPEEILARPYLKIQVLATVELQHINAVIATNSLRPFFANNNPNSTAGLTLGNAGSNRAILLQGFSDQVAAAIRVLRQVDQPAAETTPDMEQRLQQLEQQVRALQKALAEKQGDGK